MVSLPPILNMKDEGLLGRAAKRAEKLQRVMDSASEMRLRKAARDARGARKKLFWLQKAADLLGKAAEASEVAACRRGCAHCCHISVQITEIEASLISKHSGKPVSTNPADGVRLLEGLASEEGGEWLMRAQQDSVSAHTGVACPFLGPGNDCTVYEVRPLACRLHLSLSDDDVPCRLSGSEGGETGAEVLYVNTMARKVNDAVILGVDQKVADIRDWFPPVE